jgi:hypothetical protein
VQKAISIHLWDQRNASHVKRDILRHNLANPSALYAMQGPIQILWDKTSATLALISKTPICRFWLIQLKSVSAETGLSLTEKSALIVVMVPHAKDNFFNLQRVLDSGPTHLCGLQSPAIFWHVTISMTANLKISQKCLPQFQVVL